MEHLYAVDCHNHSAFSPDGFDPVEAKLARAKELGLYALTLTDHCECQAFEGEYRHRARRAWEGMARAEAACPQGLVFLKGIELGQPMENPAAMEEVLTRPYDFVLGSLHNLKDEEDFYYMRFTPEEMDRVHGLLSRYWAELLALCQEADFDSLGHLTYPIRYLEGQSGLQVDLTPHLPAIDAVLRALIRRGKALEVNTSGYRTLGRPLPDLPLLQRYRALGGRLITLGSDAHRTEDLGFGIDRGMELLRAAGFTEFALYVGREPRMLPLE